MLCIIVYNPLAVPLIYFLYSRGCGRHGLAVIVLRVAVMDFFGGRYRLWPSWFVAVIVVPPVARVHIRLHASGCIVRMRYVDAQAASEVSNVVSPQDC